MSFEKSLTNFLPVGPRLSFGWPATDTYWPSAAPPAPSTTAEIGVKPSGERILTSFPSPDRRSLISFPPFPQMSPPRKTASAPACLIFVARPVYDEALPFQAENPATLIPTAGFVSEFLKSV